jgi:acyl carrier protein
MTDSDIRSKIKEVFVKNFELDENIIQDDKLLFDDLGLDSLDIVDLIVGLQRVFKIDLRKYSEIKSIRTFGDVCNVMNKIIKEQPDEMNKIIDGHK